MTISTKRWAHEIENAILEEIKKKKKEKRTHTLRIPVLYRSVLKAMQNCSKYPKGFNFIQGENNE